MFRQIQRQLAGGQSPEAGCRRAALVLGARYNAGPFEYAEIDVMGTVRVSTALAASDQLKLTDGASANGACNG